MSLMTIQLTKVIAAKRWKVLRLLTRIEDFPRMIPNIKQCRVLERPDKRHVISSWEVEMENIPLRWKEEDHLDFENFSIHFKSIEGDLERFEGTWQLEETPSGGTCIRLTLSLSLGIPLLDQVMQGVFESKVRKSFSGMLDALNEILTMRRYKNISNRKISDLKGFAVIGHPYNLQHLVRYFKYFRPDFKLPSQEFLVKLFEMTPAYKSYDIQHFKSKTGKETHGYFIMCPIIPDMVLINPDQVVRKVIQACKVAEDLGVGIVTLGGFTSIAGEMYGKSLIKEVNIPITTGNTFTIALALDGILKAAELMGIELSKASVTVIGGAGDIGGTCARILAESVRELTITGRSEKNLMEMERILSYYGKAKIRSSRNNNDAIRKADIVLAAASSSSSIVDFASFKPGAVICDVGYPKNISYTQCQRDDILIFSGGIATIPSEFDIGFDIGMPARNALYGCFAEAILLDLEERYDNFSWGKGTTTHEKIQFIRKIAGKHGFELAPFFWGNRIITEEGIEHIRNNAGICR